MRREKRVPGNHWGLRLFDSKSWALFCFGAGCGGSGGKKKNMVLLMIGNSLGVFLVIWGV